MDGISVTEEQVSGTQVLLNELRGLIGDEAIYDELYKGLDPEHYLVLRAAKELTGISTYDNNHELEPWDKVIEIENDAFGFDKSTEQYKQYEANLWRLTVDKLAGEIRTSMLYEDWRELDLTISQELHYSQLHPDIVGEITYHDTNEKLTFTDSAAYLSELKDALNVRGISGWSHVTRATDVDTLYQVACLTYGEFGDEINKDAFYRLYKQHGADMGLWGDSKQWVVQEEYYSLEPAEEHEPPAEDIEPPLSLSELQASRRIEDVVATYEELFNVPDTYKTTYYFGDYGAHYFKYQINDTDKLEMAASAVAAMGMSLDDIEANPDFIHRGMIIKHMCENNGLPIPPWLQVQLNQIAAREPVKVPHHTSLADRLAAAKEQCAQQNHDRPAPRHDRGMER